MSVKERKCYSKKSKKPLLKWTDEIRNGQPDASVCAVILSSRKAHL